VHSLATLDMNLLGMANREPRLGGLELTIGT